MALTAKCFCMCPTPTVLSAASQAAAVGRRAALLKEAFWGPNPTITVAFLGGEPVLRKRVEEAAKLWITDGGAKVTLSFLTAPGVDPQTADIRIAFTPGLGSWSYLGTQCRNIPKHEPTMNFGWIDAGSSETDVRSVVLHEFGHALGLIHEHQNPKQGIDWDRAAVKADLSGPPNNWDDATIENNMFKKYDKDTVIATSTDPTSIMMYQIPQHWTRDGFSAGFNSTLSAKDKQLIQENYF
jgi:serralysin